MMNKRRNNLEVIYSNSSAAVADLRIDGKFNTLFKADQENRLEAAYSGNGKVLKYFNNVEKPMRRYFIQRSLYAGSPIRARDSSTRSRPTTR